MPDPENADLPRSLGDGLVLRWASSDDIEALARYNAHGREMDPAADNPLSWTHDLMSGRHPTTQASDFTIVTDENDGGKIVSSMCLISQTWDYAGIPFKVGRPELVSTDPQYRRRGLVRDQFAAIHALSAARGELALAIDGVGWFYRQFGYQMALNRGGSRRLLPFRLAAQPPPYRRRKATPDDIPLLAPLYDIHRRSSLISRLRDEAQWRYEMTFKPFWIFEDASGAPVGYSTGRAMDDGHDPELLGAFVVDEVAARPGQSLPALAAFLARDFTAYSAELDASRATPLNGLAFELGPSHQLYDALGPALERFRPYWSWYMRVPNLPAFLRHIAPLLEARLAASALANHSGTLRLNFYRSQLTLVFETGKLAEIGTFTPEEVEDGDARFPDMTFLHLLFGNRSIAEINHLYADCYASHEAEVLLGILFPCAPSNPLALD